MRASKRKEKRVADLTQKRAPLPGRKEPLRIDMALIREMNSLDGENRKRMTKNRSGSGGGWGGLANGVAAMLSVAKSYKK